ncbi:hypothetical protein OIU77_019946 [Salix suchowensis]|uniref:CASP-like protein n=1 Tax=Salix suchowensis TaxID=1278906 RepID=A0ABQ9CHV2_9ROSI|nr:hypothetical protein OIU77_019946 [Salix suchowensis]
MGVVSPWPSFLFFKRERWEAEAKAIVSVFCTFSLLMSILSMLLCHAVSLPVSCSFERFNRASSFVFHYGYVPTEIFHHAQAICKGAACPGTFQEAAAKLGSALDS